MRYCVSYAKAATAQLLRGAPHHYHHGLRGTPSPPLEALWRRGLGRGGTLTRSGRAALQCTGPLSPPNGGNSEGALSGTFRISVSFQNLGEALFSKENQTRHL